MLKNNTFTPAPALKRNPVLHTGHVRIARGVLKRVLLLMAVAYGVVVAGQLVYPAKRSVPSIGFGGYSLGNMSEEEIKNQLSAVAAKTFTARTENKEYTQTLGDIGISLDTEQIARELSDYPLAQRMLPFSVFYYKPQSTRSHLIVHDKAKLDTFVTKVATENNSEPKEGTIHNKSGELVIERSLAGKHYDSNAIASYFAAFTSETLGDEAVLPFEAVSPINTYQYLDDLIKSTTSLTNEKHVVLYGDAAFEVNKSAIRDAVKFVAGQDKKVVLEFDATLLVAGLEAAADGVFYAPAGQSGHELDWNATAEALAVALKSSVEARAVLKPLSPSSGQRYPATSNGIQALISDWQNSHASISPVISFSEIGGYKRSASIGGDTKYFSASIYKVFPAWYLLDQIDQGKQDPKAIVAAGMNLENCFHDMIIISQSKCSEAIVYKYGGWAAMDAFAREHGIEGITLSEGVTITANGMTSFLTKLHTGELLSQKQTDYLLAAMKRQKYRTGFAASGFEVANKVGYQPKTKSWHDAAIMYHPKGTYVLVVLTKEGATLPMLSTLAQQINETLNR